MGNGVGSSVMRGGVAGANVTPIVCHYISATWPSSGPLTWGRQGHDYALHGGKRDWLAGWRVDHSVGFTKEPRSELTRVCNRGLLAPPSAFNLLLV